MKFQRWCSFILVSLLCLLGSSAFATSSVGTQVTDTYKINTTSFTAYGLNATDAIQAAAGAMTWGYSSRVAHKWDGTSTVATTCQKAAHIVVMNSTPHASGLREVVETCGTSGAWVVRLYPAPGTRPDQSWYVGGRDDGKRDIQAAVQKMFLLMSTGAVSTSGEPCLSTATTNAQLLAARGDGACNADVELLGAAFGHLQSSVSVAGSAYWPASGSYPTPPTGWGIYASPNYSGLGGVSFERQYASAYNWEAMSTTVANISPHNIYTTAYGVAGYTGTGSYQYLGGIPSASPFGFGKTSTAYDFTRSRWIVGEIDFEYATYVPQVVSSLANTGSQTFVTSFYNLCWPYSWSSCGAGQIPVGLSKMPIAVAYDPATDQIIIAGTRGSSTSGACGGAGATTGCAGELAITTVYANSQTSGLTTPWSPPQRVTGSAFGTAPVQLAIGSPTMYCSKVSSAPTASTPNCELIAPTIDSSGVYALRSLKFRANANDMVNSIGPTSVGIEGTWTTLSTDTTFPADAKSDGQNNTGLFSMVILKDKSGAAQGQIGLATKSSLAGSWSSFNAINNVYTGVPITSTNAPAIALSETLTDYVMLYTTN